MNLDRTVLEHKEDWIKAGYDIFQYNRDEMVAKTKENPYWIHFGAGNIFRAFPAKIIDDLLNEQKLDKGLIVAEGFDYEIIKKVNKKYDNHSILVTMHTNGTLEKTVIGSVAEALEMNRDEKDDFSRLQEIFKKPSLQLASFTITEKGYDLLGRNGDFLDAVKEDFVAGPEGATSYMGKLASLLYTRFREKELPIALVSMDNCSHNGEKLFLAMKTFANKWVENQKVPQAFQEYVISSGKVSFPWSMIDKITPRPDERVAKQLKEDGVDEVDIIVTNKNTYTAPFVNAEECQYLVIEDDFPNGRPDFSGNGVFFTDKETVNRAEKMKVCTCLNPIHTTLAIFGCLLGFEFMSDAIKDKDLKALVEEIGYGEGLKVVEDPKILIPKDFIKEVFEVRIPNPYMPDTPKRIATDTSKKLSIRFGETIKAYKEKEILTKGALSGIELVFAAWLRYLLGVDDKGMKMELSPDPNLEMLTKELEDIQIGKTENISNAVKPLLENEEIFGVNLYEVDMAEAINTYFTQMTEKTNGVRKVLSDYVEKLGR